MMKKNLGFFKSGLGNQIWKFICKYVDILAYYWPNSRYFMYFGLLDFLYFLLKIVRSLKSIRTTRLQYEFGASSDSSNQRVGE